MIARRSASRAALVFAQFRDETDRVARGLIAAGIEPGDHVCLWLGNRPEYLFICLALAKIGAVLVPINTRFRTRDMAYIVTQSDATTLISADRSGPIDYLAMIEELVTGPAPADSPSALSVPELPGPAAGHPARRRAGRGHAGLGRRPEAGRVSCPDREVQRRCAATDSRRDGVHYVHLRARPGFPKGVMQRHNAIRNVARPGAAAGYHTRRRDAELPRRSSTSSACRGGADVAAHRVPAGAHGHASIRAKRCG